LHRLRLAQRRSAAQGLIGRFAALKATGVAINPLVLLDLAGGLALDTALVLQLCQLYGLPMGELAPASSWASSRPRTPCSVAPSWPSSCCWAAYARCWCWRLRSRPA
jgi:hypothetical protein